MLRQRVLTALVMAGLFLAAVTWLTLPALAVALALLVALGAWEWARLAGWVAVSARALYVVLLLVLLAALYRLCGLGTSPSLEQVQPVLGMAGLWWAFALLWVKGYPGSAAIWRSVALRSLMGLLVLAPAWLAAVYLLSYPHGAVLLIALVAVVAAADIGAYFTGRTLGRHKLAPAVSPGKTWEGFWGGLASCVLLAVLLWLVLPGEFLRVGPAALIAVAVTTALASVVGDLTVSMVKRESGVKDSGSLLPGHGGLLDRLDSLCGAAPVFSLGLLLAGW